MVSMADTELETLIDAYVRDNLLVLHSVYKKNGNSWDRQNSNQDLNDDTPYKMVLQVLNKGSETYVKNVNIRCVRRFARVTLYSDDTYSGQVARSDSPIWPATVGPGGLSNKWTIYFKIAEGPDQLGEVIRYGLYVEVIPQGHFWGSITRQFD